jgi:hypothetical protein
MSNNDEKVISYENFQPWFILLIGGDYKTY